MTKKINEAINIPGAELIGTAKGYDLFDMRTYAAAQQFVVETTNTPAGAAYAQNEATFNQNINEAQHLYFFVESETNHVYAGAVKSNNTHSDVTIKGNNAEISIHVNFLFEINGRNKNKIFPLFLIPNINVSDAVGNLIIRDTMLEAVLPQLTPDESISLDLSATSITSIDNYAFSFNMHINELILGDNVHTLRNASFDNVDHIKITWAEKPAGWSDTWFRNYEDKIEYLQAGEIERIRQQRQQEAELARQRAAEIAAEAARQKAEQERLRIERERQELISKIRYKKEGKEITIIGLKPSANESITIPETIDGLPVTKIGNFAFYHFERNISIRLPATIKEIGQGAFAYSKLRREVDVPRGCRVGKNAFYAADTF